MKKKLTSKLMLKIVSLIVAFLFWLVIINITDPTTSKTFYDIPVQILNENVITSANQVFDIVDGDTVKVTVKGKRSFVEKLKESDFTATADLSELSKVNAVSINVKLNKESTSSVDVDWNNAVLKVALEKRITKSFKVEVDYEGELSENYVLGEMTAKPNMIEVSCGESKFKKIDHVGVMVSLKGQSEDFDSEYSPVLYDANGDALNDANVSFSNDTIKVSTQVLSTKEIPVYVETEGAPASGYRLVQTDYKPESIQVSGTKEALEKEVSIKVPISIARAKKDIEKEIDLREYLSSGLSIVGETTTVSVRCDIEKNGQRVLGLTSSDIAVRNLPKNYTMNFEPENGKYSVELLGEDATLADVNVGDLGAYVDLNGLSDGSHTLELKYSLPTGVQVKNKIKIKVKLKRQEGEVTDAPSTPTPTVE